MKRNVGESVQYYCVRFNTVYNAIPADIKPPMGLALIKFIDGFDTDMAYQLRERDPTTLQDMQKNEVSVEENLLAKRARMKTEKKVTIKEEASSSDVKGDHILRKIEKMFDQLTIADKLENTIRNPNFRGQQQPQFQIKQREQKAQDQSSQQQVKTPLQQNYVHRMESEDDDDLVVEANHFFTADGLPIFLTENEEYLEVSHVQTDEDVILANEGVLEDELDDYQRRYMNALTAQQKQYSLRSRDVPISLVQKEKRGTT